MAEHGDPRATALVHAFRDDHVAQWLVPEREHRHRIYATWLGMVVQHVDRAGQVLSDYDDRVVQLWLPADGQAPPLLDDEQDRALREVTGECQRRFDQLGEAMEENHPGDSHEYLALVGTVPSVQGTGRGGAAMRDALARNDDRGVGSYLEASSARSRALYQRLGFHDSAPPIELPDGGPTLYPMYRPPHSAEDR